MVVVTAVRVPPSGVPSAVRKDGFMLFDDFINTFNPSELLDLDDSERVLYSRVDLKQKENIVELIAYPSSMIDGWESKIESLLQVPFCWVLHDKDNCEPHLHIIIQWNNNVQMSYFLKFFNQFLSKEGFYEPGKPYVASKLIKPVKNPEEAYNYLIHDTPKARSEGKYQYSQLDRHCCNGFDIHFIKQLDTQKKYIISSEISDYIVNYKILDLIKVTQFCQKKGIDYYQYLESHSGFFDRLCAGNWKELEREKKKQQSEKSLLL